MGYEGQSGSPSSGRLPPLGGRMSRATRYATPWIGPTPAREETICYTLEYVYDSSYLKTEFLVYIAHIPLNHFRFLTYSRWIRGLTQFVCLNRLHAHRWSPSCTLISLLGWNPKKSEVHTLPTLTTVYTCFTVRTPPNAPCETGRDPTFRRELGF